MKEAKCILRNQRISAQKVRLELKGLRGKSAEQAVEALSFRRTKAAKLVLKTLVSAMANAENNHDMDMDALIIHALYADEGFTMKRMRARARGRSTRILKRTCHVTVVVSEREEG